MLASGKILAGVAVVENEFHQVAALRAARAAGIATMEEGCLEMARPLVARLPFPKLDLLIVDELGKNVSGTGMDTKTVGRGVELHPGEAPQIRLIYVRDLTPKVPAMPWVWDWQTPSTSGSTVRSTYRRCTPTLGRR